MTGVGLIALKQALAAEKGRLTGPEARAAMEQQLAQFPEQAGVQYSSEMLGTVPIVRAVPQNAKPGKTLLYFHGGGFVMGSAEAYRHFAAAFAKRAGCEAIVVDYRLAPEHAFPAAVEDALASYKGVLSGGKAPASVVLAGDSAGGGLVASTMIAARDEGLPLPAGAVLISPWLDLDRTGSSIVEKADVDPLLTEEALGMMATQYLQGFFGHSPLGSPIHADLSGLPPLLIQVGSDEILLDDSTRFAERARQAGVEVTLEIWPEMFHVWHLFAAMLSESREAIQKAGAFMEAQFERGETLRESAVS